MNWLVNLIDKLFAFIPRLLIVEPDEGGVRTTLGKHAKLLEPGWHFYWPMIQDGTTVTVTPQVVDLRPQSVSMDGNDYCISGAIQYRIKDAKMAILNVNSFDESLQALALGVISEYVNTLEPGKILTVPDIKAAVLKGIKENARGWGLDIMKVFITDLGSTKNVRILSGVASTPYIELGEK